MDLTISECWDCPLSYPWYLVDAAIGLAAIVAIAFLASRRSKKARTLAKMLYLLTVLWYLLIVRGFFTLGLSWPGIANDGTAVPGKWLWGLVSPMGDHLFVVGWCSMSVAWAFMLRKVIKPHA
jgi:hypothetical protein